MKTKNDIKESIEKFNKLTLKKQEYIVRCLKSGELIEFNNINILDPNDISLVLQLRDNIIEIVDDGIDNIVKKLCFIGLEESAAKSFCKYCIGIASPIKDAEIIKILSKEQFTKIVDFIIYNVFVYHDLKYYTDAFLASRIGLDNVSQTNKVIRFLYHFISEVAGRNISPELLKYKLATEFGISNEFCDIFYTGVINKISEIQQAYLTSRLNKLYIYVQDIIKLLNEKRDMVTELEEEAADQL